MAIAQERLEEAVNQVTLHHRERKPAEGFSGPLAEMGMEEAYRVQYGLIRNLCADGQKVIGHKVAGTNRGGSLNFAHLMSSGVYPDGSSVSTDGFVEVRVEAEMAFLLARDLKGPGVTPLSVVQATEGVLAAIEVVDFFVTGSRQAIDVVANNIFNAGVVLGPQLTRPADLNLRYEGVVMELDGEVCGSAAGADVLGNPVHSVAWLANRLADFDDHLRAGEVIISGAMAGAVSVSKGSHFSVTFTRLGTVGVRFV